MSRDQDKTREQLIEELRELRKQTEEALGASEERFRAIAETAKDSIFIKDLERRYTYVNPAMTELFGCRPEDLIGKTPEEIFDPASARTVAEVDKVALEGGTADKVRALAIGGQERVFHTIQVPLRNTNNDISGICGIVRDITERKQSEELLRKSGERYRILVENNPYGIQEIDCSGTIVYANQAHHQMYGYQGGDLIGRSMVDLLAPGPQRDELPGYLKVLVKDQPLPTAYQEKILTEQGQERDVEVVWNYQRDTEGSVTGFISVLTDITERKRAEEALRRYGQIVSSSTDMLALLNTDFVYLAANDAYANSFDKSRDEIVGHTASEIFGEGFFRTVIKPHAERCLNGEEVRYREWFDFADRRSFMEITYCPYIAESGEVEGFVVNARNLTAQKLAEDETSRLEEQLHLSQKMEAIGTLAGGIAHDFNNLLTGILGYADLLEQEAEPETTTFEACRVIKESAERAAELTKQLLGFARRGKQRDAPVDMHRVIGDTIAILARTIDKRITIAQHLAAEKSVVNGDTSQLQQVVMNIAINGGEAMSDAGTLAFETAVVELDEEYCHHRAETLPGTYLMASISDTGTGIPDNILPHIFDPFFTTKEVGKGTGLGMAMVYGIVKNHGGHISVESEIGHGTTFKVYLPLEETQSPKTDSGEYNVVAELHGRILVVDDENAVCQVAASILTSLGCEVICVHNGKEAVDYCEANIADLDLVILDLTMPVMNGRDCFYALKRFDPNVKVIIATGHALDRTGQQLLDAGALRFFQKPFTPNELAEAVAKALKA